MTSHLGSQSRPYRKPQWPTYEEVVATKPTACPRCHAPAHNLSTECLGEYADGRDLFFRCHACAYRVFPTLTPTMVVIVEPSTHKGRKS